MVGGNLQGFLALAGVTLFRSVDCSFEMEGSKASPQATQRFLLQLVPLTIAVKNTCPQITNRNFRQLLFGPLQNNKMICL